MKYLTFDAIKAQLRLDDEQASLEHDLLEDYGTAAEDAILNLTGRSYTDIIETYGEVPRPISIATLMLVDNWYKERSPISPQPMSTVRYAFDVMVKPYMRLATTDTPTTTNTNQYGRHCNL